MHDGPLEDKARWLHNRAARLAELAVKAHDARLASSESLTKLANEASAQADEIERQLPSPGADS